MIDLSNRTVNHTPEEQRLLDLLAQSIEVQCFEVEGRKYLGNRVQAVKNFIKNNPNKADFSIWLQDNYKELNTK